MSNNMLKAFLDKKKRAQNAIDRSRKGDIDESIQSLIVLVNNFDEYITTSSCSGRITLMVKDEETRKKGCLWVASSHTTVDPEFILQKVRCGEKNLVFKFEPFILHVKCIDFKAAKRLQLCALNSGFQNSGCVFGRKGNITFTVRGSHTLEVPLTSDCDELLVSDKYIRYIVDKANIKMSENGKRIERFSKAVQALKTSHN